MSSTELSTCISTACLSHEDYEKYENKCLGYGIRKVGHIDIDDDDNRTLCIYSKSHTPANMDDFLRTSHRCLTMEKNTRHIIFVDNKYDPKIKRNDHDVYKLQALSLMRHYALEITQLNIIFSSTKYDNHMETRFKEWKKVDVINDYIKLSDGSFLVKIDLYKNKLMKHVKCEDDLNIIRVLPDGSLCQIKFSFE